MGEIARVSIAGARSFVLNHKLYDQQENLLQSISSIQYLVSKSDTTFHSANTSIHRNSNTKLSKEIGRPYCQERKVAVSRVKCRTK